MHSPARSILLCGFEPFGDDVVNPSWEVARALDRWRCGGAPVVARSWATTSSTA